MTYSDPQSAPASPNPAGQPNLAASGLSSGVVAPFLAFSMGRRIALLAVVPFALSVVFVVAGLVLGVTHGVDWVYGRVDLALALLLDAGWPRADRRPRPRRRAAAERQQAHSAEAAGIFFSHYPRS